MELFYKGRVTKVVLILLWRHVVGSHDVLLEHELLWVLLTLAKHALVHAAISPVIFANFDRVCGWHRDAGDAGDLNLWSWLTDAGLHSCDNLSVGGVLISGSDELVVIVLYGNTVTLQHMALDGLGLVLYLVPAQLALVLTAVVLQGVLSLGDLVPLQQVVAEFLGPGHRLLTQLTLPTPAIGPAVHHRGKVLGLIDGLGSRHGGAATVPIVTDMRMTNPAVSILRVFKLAPRFFC